MQALCTVQWHCLGILKAINKKENRGRDYTEYLKKADCL